MESSKSDANFDEDIFDTTHKNDGSGNSIKLMKKVDRENITMLERICDSVMN